MKSKRHLAGILLAAASCAWLRGQEPPALTPTPVAPTGAAPEAAASEAPVFRPLEGTNIIDLPSVDVPREGTLTLLFTHRFQEPVQDSSIRDLYSFDSGADIGIGLGYTPVKNFDVSFYRSSFLHLGIYEIAGKYRLFDRGPVAASLRVGDDLRTAEGQQNHSTFFVQGIVAVQLGDRIRLTAVPTYLTKTTGQQGYFTHGPGDSLTIITPLPVYRNIFNVPVAATIALTSTITIHGEVVPTYSRAVLETVTCVNAPCPPLERRDRPGIGWSVAIEKTLLRHRFAFTAGNLRETTVDQYMMSNFNGNAKNIHIGFNLVRQWKLK